MPQAYSKDGTDFVPDADGGEPIPFLDSLERQWLSAPASPPTPSNS